MRFALQVLMLAVVVLTLFAPAASAGPIRRLVGRVVQGKACKSCNAGCNQSSAPRVGSRRNTGCQQCPGGVCPLPN